MTALRLLLILSLLLTYFNLVAGPSELPDIGSSTDALVSPEQERQLGEAFMRRLHQSVTIIEDPEISAYLGGLGNQLLSGIDDTNSRFDFFIVKDPSINAFAAPGGFIGINSGLILMSKSESELAGVMAHEIAHVTQRHLARAYDTASRMSIPRAAAMLAAILIGTQNSEAGQAALMTIQAGSIQQQINFTRANEKEADRVGMQTLVHSGLDPMGMSAFFDRLQQSMRLYGNRPPEFLSTHPVTIDRIADAQARARQYTQPHTSDSLEFQLMRTRLHVLTADDPKVLIDYFTQVDSTEKHEKTATRYGLALSLQRSGNPAEAQPILKALNHQDPDRIAYIVALAENELLLGSIERALQRYTKALANYPNNPTLGLYYARSLLLAEKPEKARTVITNLIHHQNDFSLQLYRMLAKAEADMGRKNGAHEALAEYYYHKGQLYSAIEQLELALNSKDSDFIQTARMEARLHTFKTEAKLAKQH